MGRQFWTYFLVGLAVVGGGIFAAFYWNQGSRVDLTGSILKVRSYPDGAGAIVFVDFRVTNPSTRPFVVNGLTVAMETPDNEVAMAVTLSKEDAAKIARYYKLIGPQYNDVLAIRDTIAPVETVDRMVAARFNFPPKFLEQRKTLHLRIQEVDGAVADITEKK